MGIVRKLLFATFIIAYVVFPDPVTCCDGASPKYGNMSRDQEVEVGSSFYLACTLFNNTITYNGTDYYVSSENLFLKFGGVVLKDLDVIDESSVGFTLVNASVNDTGVYNCFLSIDELPYNPFVCSSYVAVGFQPRSVKNFSCISLNYQKLSCSWEKPFNPVKTKYELWDYIGVPMYRRKCPVLLDSGCEWHLDTVPPYRKSPKVLQFMMVGNNSLGFNTQFVSLDHYKIVKPSMPQKLMFSNVSKDSLVVRWLPPKGMEYGDIEVGLIYYLHYCPPGVHLLEMCGVLNVGTEHTALVTKLVPFTEYRFMLRCRTNVPDSLWSPFLNGSIRTVADVPYLAPETSRSSFQVQNVQKGRTIILYWKPVPFEFENGMNFSYIIHFHRHYVVPRSKREDLEVDVGNYTSYTFKHMDLSTAYLFKIFAKNNVGISYNSSIIIVDKADKIPTGPQEISVLARGQGKYTVSWKSSVEDPMNSVQNHSLFWCRDIKPRPFNCKGPLDWMTVFGTYQELNLSDTYTNYQFAVATNYDHSTTGMTWASCVVPYSGVLYKVRDVVVTPKNSTSIRVHWSLDCSAQKSVVQEYAITFCPVHADSSCSEKPSRINLPNPMIDQYIVGSLRPFTKYKFIVIARTADGWSEDSVVKYETTMSAAPSGPPRHVEVIDVNGTVIKVAFQPPVLPNGRITRYSILYGKTVSSPENINMQNIDYTVSQLAGVYEAEINRSGISFHTNYSIVVDACVNLACSPHSQPVYAFTGIGTPGPIDPPHTEVINATFVNVTWKPPEIPNGPIDMYILTMVWQEGEDSDPESSEIRQEVYNVTGEESYFSMSVDCHHSVSDGMVYYFSVQALNVRNGMLLYSLPSEPTQTRLCFISPEGLSFRVLIGLVIGVAIGFTALVSLVYLLAKWMKKKVDMVKGITVQLPTGLDSPTENPLNTYDKFKSGLQKNRDAGIPSEHTYERLGSYAADKMPKNLENSYDASSEEFLNGRSNREKSGRNQSGDSSVSGKGHDSIASAHTNKTHISIDSGTEVDLPPSPDGIFSDTSSSNTTPRSYKPDLEIVEESHPSVSKDSGLDRDGISPIASISKGADLSSKFPIYIRKKNHLPFNPQGLKKSGQIQPYSKFAIIAPAFTSNYVPVGVNNMNLLDQQSLANSEPSVAEFQDDNDSQPLMLSGVPPYCRFGLARSVGNGLNITNQALPVSQNLGYSKFGVIYSAIRNPNENKEETFHGMQGSSNSSQVIWPKLQQKPVANQTLPFLSRPVLNGSHKPVKQKPLDVLEEKPDGTSCNDVKLLNAFDASQDVCQDIDINSTSESCKKGGYVSFNSAMYDFFASGKDNASAQAEDVDASKVNVGFENDDSVVDDAMPKSECEPKIALAKVSNGATEQDAAEGKSKSYVSFEDAKNGLTQPGHTAEDVIQPLVQSSCSSPSSNSSSNAALLSDSNNGLFKCSDQETVGSSPVPVLCGQETSTASPSSEDISHEATDCVSGELSDLLNGFTASFEHGMFKLDDVNSDDSESISVGAEAHDCLLSQKPPTVNGIVGSHLNSTVVPNTVERAPDNSFAKPHASSNGYVPFNEVMVADPVAVNIITIPHSTSNMNTENV